MRGRSFRGRSLPPGSRPGAVLVLALGLYTVRSGTAVSYLHPATPIEPLVYTQTSPDLPEVAREIAAYAREDGAGMALPITVETRLSLSWPWAWYLRDYTQVLYASTETLRAEPPDAGRVLIATEWTLDELPGLRAGSGEGGALPAPLLVPRAPLQVGEL